MAGEIKLVAIFSQLAVAGHYILGFIVDNPLLLTMFCGSIVSLACYLVAKVKRTANS